MTLVQCVECGSCDLYVSFDEPITCGPCRAIHKNVNGSWRVTGHAPSPRCGECQKPLSYLGNKYGKPIYGHKTLNECETGGMS